MPNHVINRLEFFCSKEKLKEILSAICYAEDSGAEATGIGTVDFNKITPMPPSLEIESGSNTDRGINLYLTSINPSVRYYGKEKMGAAAFEALAQRLNGSRSFLRHNVAMTSTEIKNSTLYTNEDELLQLGKTAVSNLEQYGATTWYDWRTRGDTWNTKWNSYSASYDGGNEVYFQTAWSAPHPIVQKLSAMYPEVTIKHVWANEDSWQSCGSRTYLSGEMIDYDYPQTEKEQLEAAAYIWGYDLSEYGLVLNASGNSYVNTENDDFELVTVNGEKALFTNERLTLNDIPKGLFLYHLRSNDDGSGFATLEETVNVNHGGSIVTREPFDLGEKGYIALDEDSTPNFEGKQSSFAQFMDENFDTTEVIDIE